MMNTSQEITHHESQLQKLKEQKRSLGNLFKTARKRLEFSQLCVAAHFNQKTVSYISRIERGETIPTIETALKLAQILEMDLKTLAGTLVEIERIRINSGFELRT